ncbi:MAG TPA: DUF5060 domain-containing protein [Opitutaceae bacterium]|nr:DUF5060 domain-containing protein [Opitutaceae bacterium]
MVSPIAIVCRALLLASVSAAGIVPCFATTIVPTGAPALWRRAEFRVVDGPTAGNPFDPDEIKVDATFLVPSGGRVVVPAFWYQDYERSLVDGEEVLKAVGSPEWRVRYTPTEPGEYRMTLTSARHDGAAETAAQLRFAVGAASVSAQHGWVRIAPDHHAFMTSDGRNLRLVGENLCWANDSRTYGFDRWFAAMQRNGENYARLWLAPWWAPIEHLPGTLTHYRLDAAWDLDHVFDDAEARGIYLVLCFDHHGMYQEANANWGGSNNFWPTNPYNVANGGPCATPNDFFVNPRARTIYEKRLRYLIARYGSSPHLLAWQLMNEIDNVYGPLHPADVTAWHAAVGGWLHQHDPFGHLVTTSLTGGSDRPEMWKLPEMDFSVYHSYADPAPARYLAKLTQSFEAHYGKPLVIDEFGTSARGWDIAGDPYLRGLRQGLWGGALGGSTGTAMPWWWEDIDSSNAYPLWRHLANVLHAAGWSEGQWTPAVFESAGSPPREVGPVKAKATPVEVELPLGNSWRTAVPNAFAVTGVLEASRSAEELNAYLRSAKKDSYLGPIRLSVWLGEGAKLILHVNSVAGDAEVVVRADGREIGRTALPDRDGQTRVNEEYNTDVAYPLPAGHHTLEIDNVGTDWVYFDRIRLTHVRPSELAGGWKYEPEAIGLRQGNRAMIYVVSPWTVYPAGASNAQPPLLSGKAVALENWPAGSYTIRWTNPLTGLSIGATSARTEKGRLRIALPMFDDDLAGVVTPE